MSAALQIPSAMSAIDFLAWDAGDGRRWQLVDGEPRAMAPASRTHGALQGELGGLIREALRAGSSNCSLVVEPGIVPRALSAHNVRIPDLAVTCSGYASEEATLSDPVLIVEILSPNNQAETWANVWAYTSIPSVREILVLRTISISAELLRRAPDGTWPDSPASITDGELVLESVGLRVDIAAVYVTTRLARI